MRSSGMANSQAVVSALYAKVVSDVIAKSRVRARRWRSLHVAVLTPPRRKSFWERAWTRPCWKSCVWCAGCCVMRARLS